MPESDALRVEAAGLRGEVTRLTDRLRIADGVVKKQGRTTRVLIAIVLALALTSGVLTVLVKNGIGESARINNQVTAAQKTVFKTLQAQCQAWQVVSMLPITAVSGPTTFTLIAAGRHTYENLICEPLYGKLPPIDPRVVPYYEKAR
jgi:hypothetical protein